MDLGETVVAVAVLFCQFTQIAPSACAQSQPAANLSDVTTIHVDTNPKHVLNSFDPDQALGSSIDVLSRTGIDKVYSPHIVHEALSAGWVRSPIAITRNCAWQPGIGRRTERGATLSTRAAILRAVRN